MKVIELINAKNALAGIVTEKVSAQFAYNIMKFIKHAEEEEGYYTKSMQDIINRYGVKDEDGHFQTENGGIKIQPGSEDKCAEAIKDLEKVEVESPTMRFKISDFADLKLSTQDMFALLPFIDEE